MRCSRASAIPTRPAAPPAACVGACERESCADDGGEQAWLECLDGVDCDDGAEALGAILACQAKCRP